MAVLSDYTDGTITVTNGSVDFTGTDTLWRSAAFREGDTVLLQGFTGVIAGTSDDDPLILSNTTGQFTEAWPGASGTFSYRMRYQPDNARFFGEKHGSDQSSRQRHSARDCGHRC